MDAHGTAGPVRHRGARPTRHPTRRWDREPSTGAEGQVTGVRASVPAVVRWQQPMLTPRTRRAGSIVADRRSSVADVPASNRCPGTAGPPRRCSTCRDDPGPPRGPDPNAARAGARKLVHLLRALARPVYGPRPSLGRRSPAPTGLRCVVRPARRTPPQALRSERDTGPDVTDRGRGAPWADLPHRGLGSCERTGSISFPHLWTHLWTAVRVLLRSDARIDATTDGRSDRPTRDNARTRDPAVPRR
jgi:hypothetical protein